MSALGEVVNLVSELHRDLDRLKEKLHAKMLNVYNLEGAGKRIAFEFALHEVEGLLEKHWPSLTDNAANKLCKGANQMSVTVTETVTKTIKTKFNVGDVVSVSGMSFSRPGHNSPRKTLKSFAATIIKINATKKADGTYGISYNVKGNRYGRLHNNLTSKQLKLKAASAR